MGLFLLTNKLTIMILCEEKQVYLVYECNEWKNADSMRVVFISDSEELAISTIMKHIKLHKSDWCDYDGDTEEEKKEYLLEDIEESLRLRRQTPELRTNYIIEKATVNDDSWFD